MIAYNELFKRNYGVFTEKEQEKIANARILIVGCGGIGGTVAVILARSGVVDFVLVDFDIYEASNMNRQIGCFSSSLGKKKSIVIKEQIEDINPMAKIECFDSFLNHDDIFKLMEKVDFVFPAADDFAFSIFIFRQAQKMDIPALFMVPSGTWANVSIILPKSPPIEDLYAIPKLSSYSELHDAFQTEIYKLGAINYLTQGDWRADYFKSFLENDDPPTQICPTVWISSTIGAMEVLKVLSEKWKPVALPKYWEITSHHIKIRRRNGLSLHSFYTWQKKIIWPLLQTSLSKPLMKIIKKYWIFLYSYYKKKEGK
jgi:molybdopterin/thiamine biosynthesis adenylyltransferase